MVLCVVTEALNLVIRRAQAAIDEACLFWQQGALTEARQATQRAQKLLAYAAHVCQALEVLLIKGGPHSAPPNSGTGDCATRAEVHIKEALVGSKRLAAAMAVDETEGEPEVTSRWRPSAV